MHTAILYTCVCGGEWLGMQIQLVHWPFLYYSDAIRAPKGNITSNMTDWKGTKCLLISLVKAQHNKNKL